MIDPPPAIVKGLEVRGIGDDLVGGENGTEVVEILRGNGSEG